VIEPFIARALAGGLALAVIAGPLGCFVVWRRMAYFGAALAHSALLGAVLGIALGVRPDLGVGVLSLAAALLFALLEHHRMLARDTLLGVIAHAALALGLVALALLPGLRLDLMGYLFGDVLAIGSEDCYAIAAVAALGLAVLAAQWRALLLVTVSEELAAVEGVAVVRARVTLVVLVALVVAVGMRVVGLLLIVALLIIPAAAARPLARSPAGMALAAGGCALLAVLAGLGASLRWDLPAGPAIVLAATGLLALAAGLAACRRAWRAVPLRGG